MINKSNNACKYCNNAKNSCLLFIITLTAVFHSSRVIANINQSRNIENKTEWSFHDFLKNFEPKTARSRLHTGRRSIRSNEQYVNAMFDAIDATDAILELDVTTVETVFDKNDTRRHLKNLMIINNYEQDPFNYRKRLFELMKQAIYQARNEMPIWQNMRKQYRNHKLYKMGFLMSKTDNAMKIFSQFCYRAYKLCNLVIYNKIDQMYFYEILLLHERALSLWFNLQLLTDLVIRNDLSCRNTSKHHLDYLLENWKFFD